MLVFTLMKTCTFLGRHKLVIDKYLVLGESGVLIILVTIFLREIRFLFQKSYSFSSVDISPVPYLISDLAQTTTAIPLLG